MRGREFQALRLMKGSFLRLVNVQFSVTSQRASSNVTVCGLGITPIPPGNFQENIFL